MSCACHPQISRNVPCERIDFDLDTQSANSGTSLDDIANFRRTAHRAFSPRLMLGIDMEPSAAKGDRLLKTASSRGHDRLTTYEIG